MHQVRKEREPIAYVEGVLLHAIQLLFRAFLRMRFAAGALPPTPARTRAKESTPSLVHGTLYARHLIDLGDGPGVIDWQPFGQGPAEFDAGTFLATIWRIGPKDQRLAPEARHTEETDLPGTAGLVDAWAVAWYRAAKLLGLAH